MTSSQGRPCKAIVTLRSLTIDPSSAASSRALPRLSARRAKGKAGAGGAAATVAGLDVGAAGLGGAGRRAASGASAGFWPDAAPVAATRGDGTAGVGDGTAGTAGDCAAAGGATEAGATEAGATGAAAPGVAGASAAGGVVATGAGAIGLAWLHAASSSSSNPQPRILFMSARVIETEFVAVQVAEISGVETLAARTCCPFIRAAELESPAMHRIDLGCAVHLQGHHDAVPDRRGLLVERLGEGQSRLIRLHGPGDKLLRLHHALGAHVGEQRIVVRGRACEIVGTECHIADHGGLHRLRCTSR